MDLDDEADLLVVREGGLERVQHADRVLASDPRQRIRGGEKDGDGVLPTESRQHTGTRRVASRIGRRADGQRHQSGRLAASLEQALQEPARRPELVDQPQAELVAFRHRAQLEIGDRDQVGPDERRLGERQGLGNFLEVQMQDVDAGSHERAGGRALRIARARAADVAIGEGDAAAAGADGLGVTAAALAEAEDTVERTDQLDVDDAVGRLGSVPGRRPIGVGPLDERLEVRLAAQCPGQDLREKAHLALTALGETVEPFLRQQPREVAPVRRMQYRGRVCDLPVAEVLHAQAVERRVLLEETPHEAGDRKIPRPREQGRITLQISGEAVVDPGILDAETHGVVNGPREDPVRRALTRRWGSKRIGGAAGLVLRRRPEAALLRGQRHLEGCLVRRIPLEIELQERMQRLLPGDIVAELVSDMDRKTRQRDAMQCFAGDQQRMLAARRRGARRRRCSGRPAETPGRPCAASRPARPEASPRRRRRSTGARHGARRRRARRCRPDRWPPRRRARPGTRGARRRSRRPRGPTMEAAGRLTGERGADENVDALPAARMRSVENPAA